MRAINRIFSGLFVGLFASAVLAAPVEYELDEGHVSVGFLAGHARFADVLGLFSEVSGNFVYDEQTQTLVSGSVEVEADSVFTGHKKRDGHLRDDDFLATDDYDTIRFEATGYQPDSENTGTLTGEVTMLGVTRPLSLDMTLNRSGEHPIGGAYTIGGSARGHILRSEFGMDYALADDLVSDRIELIIEFEAMRDDD